MKKILFTVMAILIVVGSCGGWKYGKSTGYAEGIILGEDTRQQEFYDDFEKGFRELHGEVSISNGNGTKRRYYACRYQPKSW